MSSELLSRAGALFVTPAAPARAESAAVEPPPADLMGVLAPAAVLPAVAGGVAAALRHAHRARTALVLRPGDDVVPRPALPAARALAKRLAARDVRAEAAGAVVRVALSADPDAGVREAWRAITGAGGVPAVIALAARSDGYDALLAQADALLLAAPPATTRRWPTSPSPRSPPSARRPRLVTPPSGSAARRLAALGLTRLAPIPSGCAHDRRREPRGLASGRREPRRSASGKRKQDGAVGGGGRVPARFGHEERGQAAILIVGGLFGLLIGALVLGAVARGIGVRSQAQKTADLAALAGARAMLDAYPRLFEPAVVGGVANPSHLERDAYLQIGRDAALAVVQRNGPGEGKVTFPDPDALAPVRIAVAVTRRVEVERGQARAGTDVEASATAELSAGPPLTATGGGGEYAGPLAHRQGQPMRPDVAQAFDRMAEAARQDGIALLITSAYRSDAEQAVLFAAHPDPKWVAPPGTSLHRNGTELDLGPAGAYGWLAANATPVRLHPALRVGALALRLYAQRVVLEPEPHGRRRRAGRPRQRPPVGAGLRARPLRRRHRQRRAALERLRQPARRPALRREQLQPVRGERRRRAGDRADDAGHRRLARPHRPLRRRRLDRRPGPPDARPPAPVRLRPARARGLQRRPGKVTPCMCVPPIAETQAYVARILGLMGGAGDLSGGTLSVRLVK